MIVGIVGRSVTKQGQVCSVGSGKDTVADMLVEGFDLVKIAMADPLKRFLLSLGYTKEQLWGPSQLREQYCPRIPISSRYALKSLGTDWGRNMMYEDIWVDQAIATAEDLLSAPLYNMYSPSEGVVGRHELTPMGEFRRDDAPDRAIRGVVFSDIRFKNEMAAVQRVGGVVLLVERSIDTLPPGADADHPSEAELSFVPAEEFDLRVTNNGTLTDLTIAVRQAYTAASDLVANNHKLRDGEEDILLTDFMTRTFGV